MSGVLGDKYDKTYFQKQNEPITHESEYRTAIEDEKKVAEQALRKKADAKIAEKRENETIRRYEIYFRPENPNDSIKDVKKELESTEVRYNIQQIKTRNRHQALPDH